MMKSIARKLTAAIACMSLVAVLVPSAAWADTGKTVTLGADLTSDQKAEVLSFFGLSESDLSDMNVITVTNSDEHKYCDASIPTSVTGTKTLSCSYIQPTTSGGINIRTANLTYVTKDTLYNALQTAGVENCNLVVTAPYEVSGTGALTGVFMAYESTGNTLDADKAAAAVQEMYETAELQQTYGDDITQVISDAKDQVISATSDMSDDEIKALVQKLADEQGITLSDSDLDQIVSLLKTLRSLDYDSDAFSNTLSDFMSQSTGIWASICNFFSGIGNFFAGLFGGGSNGNIIDGLDTNVFSLDK